MTDKPIPELTVIYEKISNLPMKEGTVKLEFKLKICGAKSEPNSLNITPDENGVFGVAKNEGNEGSKRTKYLKGCKPDDVLEITATTEHYSGNVTYKREFELKSLPREKYKRRKFILKDKDGKSINIDVNLFAKGFGIDKDLSDMFEKSVVEFLKKFPSYVSSGVSLSNAIVLQETGYVLLKNFLDLNIQMNGTDTVILVFPGSYLIYNPSYSKEDAKKYQQPSQSIILKSELRSLKIFGVGDSPIPVRPFKNSNPMFACESTNLDLFIHNLQMPTDSTFLLLQEPSNRSSDGKLSSHSNHNLTVRVNRSVLGQIKKLDHKGKIAEVFNFATRTHSSQTIFLTSEEYNEKVDKEKMPPIKIIEQDIDFIPDTM